VVRGVIEMNVEVAYNNEFMRCGQRHLRPSGARGGQANAGGARGLEYSLGIRRWGQNSKHSKNTIMTLLLL